MAMGIVDVIGMAVVFDGLVAAVRAVLVLVVALVRGVCSGRTLIDVAVVLVVRVAIVQVIRVALVLDLGVSAVRAVLMGMGFVDGMGSGHLSPHW
jgi:hypothetical protein